jgi:nicotinamide-nucleotide amidase
VAFRKDFINRSRIISSLGNCDSRDAIYNELDYLLPKSDVIIMTGGLGPTVDDITKKVLAEYFNSELVVNEQVLEYLKTFFESRNRPFTESNQRQALFTKGLPRYSKQCRHSTGNAF